MKLKSVGILFFFFLTIIPNTFPQSKKPFDRNVSPLPAPTSPVMDYAGAIDSETKTRIENRLNELRRQTNPSVEIGVAVVRTTGSIPIFDYSLAVARGWGIGSKDEDNPGALLFIAIDDRKYFTQVSRDLEDELPDGLVGSLQRQFLVPEFKKGDYGKGIEDTIEAYIYRIDPNLSKPDNKIVIDSLFPNPNPLLISPYGIHDLAGIFRPNSGNSSSDIVLTQLKMIGSASMDKNPIRMTLATVESTRGMPTEEFSKGIAKKWGIIRDDGIDGLLLLVVTQERSYSLQISDSLDKKIPKGIFDKINKKHFQGGSLANSSLEAVKNYFEVIEKQQKGQPILIKPLISSAADEYLIKRTEIISDYAGVIDPEYITDLDKWFAQKNYNENVNVLVIPGTYGKPIGQYAKDFAQKWKLDLNSRKNSELFIVISTEEKEFAVETSKGFDNRIPTETTESIIKDYLEIPIAEGKYYQGIYNTLNSFFQVFDQKQKGEPLDHRLAKVYLQPTPFPTATPYAGKTYQYKSNYNYEKPSPFKPIFVCLSLLVFLFLFIRFLRFLTNRVHRNRQFDSLELDGETKKPEDLYDSDLSFILALLAALSSGDGNSSAGSSNWSGGSSSSSWSSSSSSSSSSYSSSSSSSSGGGFGSFGGGGDFGGGGAGGSW